MHEQGKAGIVTVIGNLGVWWINEKVGIPSKDQGDEKWIEMS